MAKLRIWDPNLWFSVGVSRRPKGWLMWVMTPLAVGLAVYVIVAATVLIMAPWTLVAVFLTGIIAIAFLTVGASPHSNPDRPTGIDYALSLASLGRAPLVVELKQRLERVVNLRTPLLLTGEPGCQSERTRVP